MIIRSKHDLSIGKSEGEFNGERVNVLRVHKGEFVYSIGRLTKTYKRKIRR